MTTDKTSIDKANKAVTNRFDNVINSQGVDTLDGDTYSIVLSKAEVSAGLGLLAETIFTPSSDFPNFDEIQFQKLYSLLIHLMEIQPLTANISGGYPVDPISCCDKKPYNPTNPIDPHYPIGTGQPDPINGGIEHNPNGGGGVTGGILSYCYPVRPPIEQEFGIWILENRKTFRAGIDSAIAAVLPDYDPTALISVTFVASGFGVTGVQAGIPLKLFGNSAITNLTQETNSEGALLPTGTQIFSESPASLPIKFDSTNLVRPFTESPDYGYLNIVPESLGTIPTLALTLLRFFANLPANIEGDIWAGQNQYIYGSTQFPLSDNDITISMAYPLMFFRLYLSCFSCYLTTKGFIFTPQGKTVNIGGTDYFSSDDTTWYLQGSNNYVTQLGVNCIKFNADIHGWSCSFFPIDRVLPKGLSGNVTLSVDYNSTETGLTAGIRYNSPNADNLTLTLTSGSIIKDGNWHTATFTGNLSSLFASGKTTTSLGDTISLDLGGNESFTNDTYIANVILTIS